MTKSIYDILVAQLEKYGQEEPVREEEFPRISPPGADFAFAPGAQDATLGGAPAPDDAWKIVNGIIEAPPKDWREAEEKLRGVGVLRTIDTLFQKLDPAKVTKEVKDLFWDVALHSDDYEAVKWGIAIGCIHLTEEEFFDVLTFARHSEFTLYCAVAMLREGRSLFLVNLLPEVRQWGLVRLVEAIVRDEDLISEHDVQREVIFWGMENAGGIPMEVAFTIASHVDLSAHFEDPDDELIEAVIDLMTCLLTGPQHLGRPEDLPNWENLRDDFVKMLAKRTPDVRVLLALLAADTAEARHLAMELDEEEILRKGLKDERQRWKSLSVIHERKLAALLPDVVALLPDSGAIWVVSEMGGPQDLAALLAALPKAVDLAARAKKKMSPRNVLGPDFAASQSYSRIVAALPRLGTPEAVAEIKRAARDFDPAVRLAAVRALEAVPRDAEIAAILAERTTDGASSVAEAAKMVTG